jgi:hypothetical protein
MRQRLTIVNEGTLSEDTLQVSYRPDGQLFGPSFTPSGIFAGAPYYYATSGFPALAPGAAQSFEVTYHVPANIPVGTLVDFRDTVGYYTPSSTWSDDFTPGNNVSHHTAEVVSSFNPNYKEVNPRGTGASGIIYPTDSVLEYTIHFQNTGMWYAQHVEIIDTLDNDLDWTTLHPVFESAPCKISLYQSGGVKVAKFTFSNINLPPYFFDDQRSNGMVTFTINTLPGLATGTQFRNRASIYFDNQAPIVTNNTLNTLGSTGPLVLTNPASNYDRLFVVYPNPAQNSFSVVLNNEQAGQATMNVVDVAGKVIMTKSFAVQSGTQTIATDINQFAAGVYFVHINANGKTGTQKLVVTR